MSPFMMFTLSEPGEVRCQQSISCMACNVLSLITANCNRERGRLANEGASLLWPVNVRGHPHSGPDLPG